MIWLRFSSRVFFLSGMEKVSEFSKYFLICLICIWKKLWVVWSTRTKTNQISIWTGQNCLRTKDAVEIRSGQANIYLRHQYWDFAKHDAGIAICHYGINNVFHMSENSKLSLERSLGLVEFDWRCYLPGQRACVSSPGLCSLGSNVALFEIWLLLNIPQNFYTFLHLQNTISLCGKWEFKSDL